MGRCRRCGSVGRSASNAKTSRRYSSVRARTAPRSPPAATSGNQPPQPCRTATPPTSPARSGTTPATTVGQQAGIAGRGCYAERRARGRGTAARAILTLNRDRQLTGRLGQLLIRDRYGNQVRPRRGTIELAHRTVKPPPQLLRPTPARTRLQLMGRRTRRRPMRRPLKPRAVRHPASLRLRPCRVRKIRQPRTEASVRRRQAVRFKRAAPASLRVAKRSLCVLLTGPSH